MEPNLSKRNYSGFIMDSADQIQAACTLLKVHVRSSSEAEGCHKPAHANCTFLLRLRSHALSFTPKLRS
jgi:hypothetical protein